nr:MAG TPA: hypothetical protein [Caudoviricetes sp.]
MIFPFGRNSKRGLTASTGVKYSSDCLFVFAVRYPLFCPIIPPQFDKNTHQQNLYIVKHLHIPVF